MFALAGPLPAGALAEAAAQKPNIILICSDDVGLGNLGGFGGPFPTPQIDGLAAGGTRFEFCYSTPLCGPSRCETLTGRYPFRTGLINNRSANPVHFFAMFSMTSTQSCGEGTFFLKLTGLAAASPVFAAAFIVP